MPVGAMEGRVQEMGKKIISAALSLHFILCVCINSEEGFFCSVFSSPCRSWRRWVNAELSRALCEHHWGTSLGRVRTGGRSDAGS